MNCDLNFSIQMNICEKIKKYKKKNIKFFKSSLIFSIFLYFIKGKNC